MPFAAAGCVVTVVEPNPNALATLSRRATDAGVSDRITAVQADSDVLSQVVPAGSADLVLAHGLLEVVDDPKNTVAAMAERGRSGRRGVGAGRQPDRRTAPPRGRGQADRGRGTRRGPGRPPAVRDPAAPLRHRGLLALLTDAGLAVELVQGHGVLNELVPGSALQQDPSAQDALAALELKLARTPPLRDIAARLHAVARRSAGDR